MRKINEKVYEDTFDATYNDLLNKMNTKYYSRKDVEGLFSMWLIFSKY